MCTCRCGETGREKLGLALAGMNSILSMLGVVSVCVSIYVKVKIDDRILLLGSYTGSSFTDYLIATGCLIFLINGFIAKVALDCADRETRDTFQMVLPLFIILLFILSIMVLTAAILCYKHHFVIDEALDTGFLAAMRKYKSEPTVKSELDILQMEFRCCGADSYIDWFHVSWIHKNYVNTSDLRIKSKIRESGYLTDDVPFSCCDISALRPCIHHSMTHASKHPNFDRETIHTNGCGMVLREYFQNRVFLPSGHVAIAAFSLEIVSAILFRLLQTAIFTAAEDGDPDGPGEAYIIRACPRLPLPSRFRKSRDTESGGESKGKDGKKKKDKKKDKKAKDKKKGDKDKKKKTKKGDKSKKSKDKKGKSTKPSKSPTSSKKRKK